MTVTRKRMIFFAVFLPFFAVTFFGGYSLTWGKLFPYSPLVLDFEKTELSNVVIYRQEGGPQDDYNWVNEIVPEVEAFHRLSFSDKPRIFFFSDPNTYAARSISKARFCAFYNGDIVVAPLAREEAKTGTISMRTYLTHELSHSVLFQNMLLTAKIRYPRWLLEGIATYSARQMGTSLYPSKDATIAYIRAGNWLPPEVYETSDEDEIRLEVQYRKTFMYSEFACIVDYLIAKYGQDAFLAYMHDLLCNTNHEAVFKDSFGASFNEELSSFRIAIDDRMKALK